MTRALVALVLTLAGLAPSAAAEQSVSALAPFETLADGFVDVRGIVVDAAGDVFVADRESGIVWRIASDGTRVAVATGLERPVGLALDPRGRLLIAEERAARVARVEADGSLTTLVSGVKQPRWLAVREDGTLYMSARHLITGGTDLEPDDESAEPEMVLALSPGGTLSVFAGGFRQLQGIAVNHQALYAATTGLRSDPRADGVIFEIAILPSGAAGPPQRIGASDEFTKPLGLARDRFGALYLTTKEVILAADRSRRAVAKLHPDARVTLIAENFAKPEGLAFGCRQADRKYAEHARGFRHRAWRRRADVGADRGDGRPRRHAARAALHHAAGERARPPDGARPSAGHRCQRCRQSRPDGGRAAPGRHPDAGAARLAALDRGSLGYLHRGRRKPYARRERHGPGRQPSHGHARRHH